MLIITLILISLITSQIPAAQAQWNALNSGYAVTTNWHGKEAPIGESVTATAGTTDSHVKSIEFIWLRPDGSLARSVTFYTLRTDPYPPPNVPKEVIDYKNSTTVWYAQDIFTPDKVGDWTVKAIFHTEPKGSGNPRGQGSDKVMMRATSFFAVPEVPLGTLTIVLAMFGSLGIFALKRKRF